MGKEWRLDTNAWIEEQLEKKAKNGDIAYRAERDGISYGDAMIALAEEIDRPFREIRARNASKPVTLDEDEIDRRARSYADKHDVSYTIALDALIGPTPGAQRSVELEEAALPVDDTDAAINHRAETYAKRHNCAYEVALTAVLEDA